MTTAIEAFYDERTNTLSYVVWDTDTRDAVVIDPVLDYDPASSRTWTESVERVLDFLAEHQLKLHLILETHAHADHLSGSQPIKAAHPEAKLAVGARITEVQRLFKTVFDLPPDFPTDGRQFDRLLQDRETVGVGSLVFEVMFTPGHTPACASYRFGDALFVGDLLFMPDAGTGRCDFPGGSAHDMYRSVTTRIYTLPDDTRIYTGHDYQPGGRELRYVATVGDHKRHNVQIPLNRTEREFIEFRTRRDATLAVPKLLFQSVQVNVDAGNLPEAHDNEIRYLKIPINVFRPGGDGQVELKGV